MAAPPLLRRLTREWNRNNKNGSGTEIKKTGVEQNKKLNEKMKHVGLENQTCAFTKKQKRENQTCGFKNEKN